MNASKNYVIVFMIGAILYAMIEVIWRGFSHWSMMVAGGLSLCIIYGINNRFDGEHPIGEYILCAILITAIELIFGIIFNIMLKMNVWDYSSKRFNLFGQICPLYTFYWLLLSVPGVYICDLIKDFFSKNIEK